MRATTTISRGGRGHSGGAAAGRVARRVSPSTFDRCRTWHTFGRPETEFWKEGRRDREGWHDAMMAASPSKQTALSPDPPPLLQMPSSKGNFDLANSAEGKSIERCKKCRGLNERTTTNRVTDASLSLSLSLPLPLFLSLSLSAPTSLSGCSQKPPFYITSLRRLRRQRR